MLSREATSDPMYGTLKLHDFPDISGLSLRLRRANDEASVAAAISADVAVEILVSRNEEIVLDKRSG